MYVNIVEKSYQIKHQTLVSLSSATDNENVINDIMQYYSDYPGIAKVRENLNFTQLSKDYNPLLRNFVKWSDTLIS